LFKDDMDYNLTTELNDNLVVEDNKNYFFRKIVPL